MTVKTKQGIISTSSQKNSRLCSHQFGKNRSTLTAVVILSTSTGIAGRSHGGEGSMSAKPWRNAISASLHIILHGSQVGPISRGERVVFVEI